MEYGKMLDDAFSYTREGVLGKGSRWVKLIIGTILLTIPLMGYVMRIYRGAAPAPEVDNWGTLCIDGLKLIVVGIVYSIPLIILEIIAYSQQIAAVLSGNFAAAASTPDSLSQNPVMIALIFLFDIIICILVPVALIRFARTNSFREAFSIGKVIDYIGKIGWLRYILAIIIISLVIGVPVFLLCFVLLLAGIVMGFAAAAFVAIIALVLILAPVLQVLQARYMTRVYDSVAPAETVPAEPVPAV